MPGKEKSTGILPWFFDKAGAFKSGATKGDIELPNKSGKTDPRLHKYNPHVLEGLKKAGEGWKTIERLAGKK